MVIGGSIQSISIGGRLFAVTADTDATRELGGFNNAVNSNGNGTARQEKTRVPWSVKGVVVEIDNTRADQEFLQGVQNSNDDVPCTLSFVDGTTYQGTGTIIDAVEYNNMSTTATVNLAGGGEMTKQ